MPENEAIYTNENSQNNPQKEIDYNEIIFNTVGYDEDGNPKTAFSIETGTYDSNSNVIKIVGNISYYNPQINIIRTGESMMIDFTYNTKTDTELRTFWSLINKYGKDFEQAIRDQSTTIPVFRITLVPTTYAGKHSIVCLAPLYWALQPETPTSDINTIRVVYNLDSIAFAETDGYSIEDVEAEIQREQMQNDFIEDEMTRRREEEEEYQQNRNEMIEEMRRNKEI